MSRFLIKKIFSIFTVFIFVFCSADISFAAAKNEVPLDTLSYDLTDFDNGTSRYSRFSECTFDFADHGITDNIAGEYFDNHGRFYRISQNKEIKSFYGNIKCDWIYNFNAQYNTSFEVSFDMFIPKSANGSFSVSLLDASGKEQTAVLDIAEGSKKLIAATENELNLKNGSWYTYKFIIDNRISSLNFNSNGEPVIDFYAYNDNQEEIINIKNIGDNRTNKSDSANSALDSGISALLFRPNSDSGNIEFYIDNLKFKNYSEMQESEKISYSITNNIGYFNTEAKMFNFSKSDIKDYINVKIDENTGKAPIYSNEAGYGFVYNTCAIPSRTVDPEKIRQNDNAFVITEIDKSKFALTDDNGKTIDLDKSTTHNFGGMVFRVKAPKGAYKIDVETTSGKNDTIISVSGMQASKIDNSGFWDAAKLVPINNYAKWNGNTWSYNFVSGLEYIDVEIEPAKPDTTVGIKSIKLTPIPVRERKSSEKMTVFTLGDSTVKSYTFDESPMCGWGQVFDDLFDDRIDVINYSMGGRSIKQMYTEGRLNDILLTGKSGDYVFIQSGHNDERSGTAKGTADGDTARFGRGATEEMYQTFITDIYIPAIRSRGMIPVLVTPMSRINASLTVGQSYSDSFSNRKFPEVMKRAGLIVGVPVIDLNQRSIEYYNFLGTEGTKAVFLSLEAGETPGKTNSGSYANGHPDNKIDGTHFKEALAKQFARMIAEEMYYKKKEGVKDFERITGYFKDDVINALETDDWSAVYPEVCNDIVSDENSYYRNQIEKLVKLGVMHQDDEGNFNPKDLITVNEYIGILCSLWDIEPSLIKGYYDDVLTREVMASILYDAYTIKFGDEKPAYMTDYNGTTITPDSPNYDPNLVGEEAQYYPLAGFDSLSDIESISDEYIEKVKKAYNLGLIRTENGIQRGKMINGDSFDPKETVSREKAAKSLYFMWVLSNPVNGENDK